MKKNAVSAIVFFAIMAALLVIGGTTAAVAAPGPNISGHWRGSNGVEYDITQIGTTFNWKATTNGEIGVGNITGTTCSAGWPFGFATGTIMFDPAGNAVEIHWNNGVVFMHGYLTGGSGPGGPPPGPGPTPPPPPTPPTPPTPPGGSGSELDFSFGPNPAWPGAEVWVNLSLPVAHNIQIWHNGAVLPITSFTSNNIVKVKLPMKVTSGPFRVEYQGKRLDSKQARSELEIKPLDIGGNWVYREYGKNIVGPPSNSNIVQNGNTFTWKVESVLTPGKPTSYTGSIYDGNKLRVTDGTQTVLGAITEVDENGRVKKFELYVSSKSKGICTHP